MCGISGWVDFRSELPQHLDIVRAMTGTLACRGPDAEGMWWDRHAVLGHRRLSVIDLEGGVQPMVADASGRTLACLSFCGEVYNFRELRRELEGHGHVFRTASDTEVVLRGYLQWGERLPERLTGMFAFAVWDPDRAELLLVRDRMGVKPLYYWPTPGGVIFGSEPKAILAHPAVSRRVDADGLYEVLDMVRTPGQAVYTGMHEVRPGELLRVRAGGTTRHRYWALRSHEHTDDLDTTIATVRRLLEDTVAGQVVADVPLCTLLSGGLDSSAVTALTARALEAEGRGPVRSFAVDFAGAPERFAGDAVRASPDTPFAREMARHVGAEHTEVVIDSAELTSPAVRRAVLAATDLPPAYWGDMWPSLYLLFKAVRERSTVALSGESADELFGGYQWFRNPRALDAETFPWLTAGSARYFGGLGLLDSGLVEKLDVPGRRAARYDQALTEVPRLPGETGRARRMREVSHLNLTRFVQTLLDRKDRMSMAVGLEVRVPFCDHRLVEYVFNVPWEMKSFDGREKSLLRAATADLLPASVVGRVKTPYPATQDPAYERALRAELAEIVADPSSPVLPLLDMDRVRRCLGRSVRDVSRPYDRGGLEMALWLNEWLAGYGIDLVL
ncbi:asparagine synthase (glutamine-hydrolyzing) [Streptomyces sp. SID8366]|uniref:asparagine synthase (glutamine-hydrolyzing) n=1 Tax=unclassified Streptomyces TaxID=2593676 RepID=UPI000DB9F70C|nr:asparagine synthase (glutamine-hydrolyzing) [Streptomyces sp. PsTaAH-130]MYU03030.1 asparagine synthase (glutamine-hydrolyzing) [Streptomyces sp. SID8366]MYU62125.1 asparagine synthase (glutamine-hydrolyzing) [Streptomyces sp. SID69]RAJ51231.1 asparagine synthase (glutamine-hydrolysing)/amidotransferase [Streptomyces sp. PsTaAH-130]